MKILAIDTTTKQSSITLWDSNNKERWEFSYTANSRTYGETIVNNLDLVLQRSSLKLEDIDLYVVTRGPGSFTGIRIGIILIKTLAQIYKKPITAPLNLDVLAYQNKFKGIIISMIPARQNEIHLAYYKNWETFDKIKKERVLLIKDFLEELKNIKEDVLITGEIPEIIRKEGNRLKNVKIIEEALSFVRGEALAELGFLMFQKGECFNYLSLTPYYGQKSSAEINWEKIYGGK